MTRRHSPIEQYRQAKQIARDNNMLISERPGGRYTCYRIAHRPIYLGQATGADGLFRLVSRFAH